MASGSRLAEVAGELAFFDVPCRPLAAGVYLPTWDWVGAERLSSCRAVVAKDPRTRHHALRESPRLPPLLLQAPHAAPSVVPSAGGRSVAGRAA